LSTSIKQHAERHTISELIGAGRVHASAGATRVLRFLPAVLGACEFRYVIRQVVPLVAALPGTGLPTLLALALLAALSGLCLRESARGLARSLPRPGWSGALAGSWMLCSAALAALLLAANLAHVLPAIGPAQPLAHSVAAGGWSTAPAVLLVGLLLAASLSGARWLLLEFVRLRRAPDVPWHSGLSLPLISFAQPAVAAPLRAGWSDRGPPAAALAAL
jgi:hypothetical protein